jgi:hypothetical protein
MTVVRTLPAPPPTLGSEAVFVGSTDVLQPFLVLRHLPLSANAWLLRDGTVHLAGQPETVADK